MSRFPFSADDREQLRRAGIPEAEAERQLDLLAGLPARLRLLRPCTVGDGVLRLTAERREELARAGAAARDAGRLLKFVPASGAATRMFRGLTAVLARLPGCGLAELARRAVQGDLEAGEAVRLAVALPRLALGVELARHLGFSPTALAELCASRPVADWLGPLLDAGGLDAARRPKALLPFHLAADGPRTAFVEQLLEGAPYLRDAAGTARFHFTVPPGSEPAFAAELARARRLVANGCELAVELSRQSRASDTLALGPDGAPARAADGALLLRPSGHGALLPNLAAAGGDLVAIKNIDNVLPAHRHAEIARWQLVLAGLAAELGAARQRDDRPLRVAAVVPAAGEPGGGPFWTTSDGGATGGAQIVEASQVDLDNAEQRRVWEASTHFNPVDLVCALRDRHGRAFALEAFVDPRTTIVTRKHEGGREIRVLERPGLWNGAMAGWETVFVELPGWTFAPVKTVLDLARPEHAS